MLLFCFPSEIYYHPVNRTTLVQERNLNWKVQLSHQIHLQSSEETAFVLLRVTIWCCSTGESHRGPPLPTVVAIGAGSANRFTRTIQVGSELSPVPRFTCSHSVLSLWPLTKRCSGEQLQCPNSPCCPLNSLFSCSLLRIADISTYWTVAAFFFLGGVGGCPNSLRKEPCEGERKEMIRRMRSFWAEIQCHPSSVPSSLPVINLLPVIRAAICWALTGSLRTTYWGRILLLFLFLYKEMEASVICSRSPS